jgi:GNAT superfamily N-acetyltransferase
MSTLNIELECPLHDSFRVQQVAGMFDVPVAQRMRETISVETPDLDAPWKVGLIVGPSGSGKTTVAKKLFGDRLHRATDWPNDQAVIDGFGDLSAREVTGLLTSVGFSSPPSWIKPYHVLSTGEQFRCDLARALSTSFEHREADQPPPIVAFDEFTSVVDRNVARIASAAIAKGVQRGTIPCRFVAVSCHYDITEWLAPDWVVDMATGTFQRRCLRRPSIELEVVRCHRRAWDAFARHHYLSGSLAPMARCYLALWRGVPTAFCAMLPIIGRRGHWRISRVVTLPDYQGVGIGMRFSEALGQIYRDDGMRMNITASHSAVIAHCRHSELWRTVNVRKAGTRRTAQFIPDYCGSIGRTTVSFEYLGQKAKKPEGA